MADYCRNLVNWIRMVEPLFQESERALNDDEHVLQGLESYNRASESATEFLQWVDRSSKLYQALKMPLFATKFLRVIELIDKALDEVSYGGIHVLSTNVLEQMEIVQDQLKAARGCMDNSPADNQLKTDLFSAQNEMDPDPSILIRLSKKLQIRTDIDLENERCVLRSISSRTEDAGDWFLTAIAVVKKLKEYVLVIPENFKCPINRDWMRDPVIACGQTYEREAIQDWLDAGNDTCPFTREPLPPKTILTPNHETKRLIDEWCKRNCIVELPKKLN